MNSLPKTVTRQRRDCDLNPGPSAPKSSKLTIRLRAQKLVKTECVIPQTCPRTNGQRDRHTHIHTHTHMLITILRSSNGGGVITLERTGAVMLTLEYYNLLQPGKHPDGGLYYFCYIF